MHPKEKASRGRPAASGEKAMRKIRPLTGQVLIRVFPPDDITDGGLFIPDIAQEAARGEKARPMKGRVIAIGPWKKNSNGYAFLPPFRVGATVICTPYRGTKLGRHLGERMQLVDCDDVLAIVESC